MIAIATRKALLAELEAYEHLMFEPMTQADLNGLYALYADWMQRLGDSPEAIAVCDALDTFIEANIDEGRESRVEQAYLELVATVQVHIPVHRDHPFRLNVTACSGRS